MRRTIAAAVAAFAVVAASACITSRPAAAQHVDVTVAPNAAYGYSDGYWDRSHQWHAWKNRDEEDAWRKENSAHFYDKRHDQEANAGWHNDQWWGHH